MNKNTYKSLIVIALAIIAVIVILFIRNMGNQNIYNGFLKPKEGAWSEIINGAEESQRIIYLGEKIVHNIPAYGIEIESIVSKNESAIIQVWRDKESNEIVEIVSKLAGKNEVICVDNSLMEILIPSFRSMLPAIATPEKYSLKNKYNYDTFTTKTGKTIQVAKFTDENSMEIWLSSEVPFGIVKIIDWSGGTETGEIIAWLQDFGLAGGGLKISESEMLNCKKMNFPNLAK